MVDNDKKISQTVIDLAIKLALLYVIVMWCFSIISPFIPPVAWGIIIAVAIYPVHLKLTRLFGGKQGRAAAFFAILTIGFIILPTVSISGSLIDSVKSVAAELKQGQFTISPPNESVAEWPIVGKKVFEFWTLASENLASALEKIEPQLKTLGSKLLGLTLGSGLAILEFIFAVIVAALLLANSSKSQQVAASIANRLLEDRGHVFISLANATIKSVAQGVLGIAFIQAILAGIGMTVMGVPAAGIWTLMVLFLAIIQLPPILILGPVAAYMFSLSSGTPEVIFLIYCLIVSGCDALLKPLILGRGVEVPMLVILMGAIGGMLSAGIIGLFVGAVVLSVGYTLLLEWLSQNASKKEAASEVNET